MSGGATGPEIWRDYDARSLNQVLNHPDVRPFVADEADGVLDLTKAVENQRNILLMGRWGGCFCLYLQPGVYEVHTQILPDGRGPWALDFVRAGTRWMFTRVDCYEIITRVPERHTAAKALARQAGMMHEFTRPLGCRWQGVKQDLEVYSFRIQDWMAQDEKLCSRGAEFHRMLNAEALRLGIIETPHANDPDHDRIVGAVWDLALGGRIRQGVMLYNRWAVVARQKPIALVSEDPVTIAMDIGRLRLAGDGIEVLLP